MCTAAGANYGPESHGNQKTPTATSEKMGVKLCQVQKQSNEHALCLTHQWKSEHVLLNHKWLFVTPWL